MKKIISTLIVLFYLMWQTSYAQIPQLWGMTGLGGMDTLGNIFFINADGSNFHNVLSFNDTDGNFPTNDLLQAANGKLYGETFNGGVTHELGNLFSIDPVTDSFENLVVYTNTNDLSGPQSNLIQANNGLIYGMTTGGGSDDFGAIFDFNTITNTISIVHEFYPMDSGGNPAGQNIMQASNGKLYGLAEYGKYYNSVNNGVIFSFDLVDSIYTDLYNFDYTLNDSDGNYPIGSLTQGSDGILYGTCSEGGINNDGTIFSFNPSTNTYKSLFDFVDTDGIGPLGSLVQLSNGKLYGACAYGGYGDGTIFSFDPSNNSFERLYEFTGYSGENPRHLMLASDGKLYGVAVNGGFYQQGDIFSFNPDSNTFKDIFDFDSTDGEYALSGLIEYNPNTGINQLSVNNYQLAIYPNPGSGAINIVSSKGIDELKVFNLLGQLVYQSYPKQMQFNFKLQNEGMYFVAVTSGNETETKKLIVVK